MMSSVLQDHHNVQRRFCMYMYVQRHVHYAYREMIRTKQSLPSQPFIRQGVRYYVYSSVELITRTLTRCPIARALSFLTPALRSSSPVVNAVSSLPAVMM